MKKILSKVVLVAVCWSGALVGTAQERTNQNKFKQLKEELATPNVYRTASGAPGHQYYQQQADYNISVELDDEKQKIYGEETITYRNNSPDPLKYLWLQLDQNMRSQESDTKKIATGTVREQMTFGEMKRMHNDFDGGFKIEYVRDNSGKALPYTINKTMMRIDLPKTLAPKGGSFTFKVKYWYNINDRMQIGGRSGYEFFPEDSNYLYTIAQFYPRLAVYNEVEGWQHKQFLGRGEFALPFGNFKVSITVPADHVVASTGTLQNESAVLTTAQRNRLKQARSKTDAPVIIVTEDEAKEAEKARATAKKTWVYAAKNVRDFGFATSRKFIWDAMAVKIGGRSVMAMSYYPKEGNPLWEQFSTRAVAHTLKVYSKHTIDYPYPKAISVHSKWIGMEYPMICFNGGRPEPDGTYSQQTKFAMISVIIHEVGHNFFPMIINSDERQWTWMDEGLNTFVQYLTEREWSRTYPARRGPAYKIVDYMKGDPANITPIMTNSESIYQFGNNAYGKPATALNILRETVMGRELFDYAFKEYAQRWKFKHPTPADFFRTMEDASGVDLDWFWRGWFYTTDYVNQSIDEVKWYKIDTKDPKVEKPRQKDEKANATPFIGDMRNKESIKQTVEEKDAAAIDFYSKYDPFEVTIIDEQEYEAYLANLTSEEKELINPDKNYYEIQFSNKGGLVMPVIVKFEFEDGTNEVYRIPAEIWKLNDKQVTKVFTTDKEAVSITLDPYLEVADIDTYDNHWPRIVKPTRFQLYKSRAPGRFGGGAGENPMQRDRRAKELQENQK